MELAANASEARFVAYVGSLTQALGHEDRARPFQDCCAGLLTPGEGKSVEPMAAMVAPSRFSANRMRPACEDYKRTQPHAFEWLLVEWLERIPQKLTDFCDENALQIPVLARFLIARTIPFERKAR